MDYYTCTTQVPNALFDQWMRDLTLSELKLLLLVTRMTRGWVVDKSGRRKVRDWLSCSRITAMTGLSKRAITTATAALISRRLLVVSDAQGHLLDDPRDRQGCTHLYYALAGDKLEDQHRLPSRSANVAEVDQQKVLITKPTLTKPTLQKRAYAHQDGRSQSIPYSGHIANVLERAVSPALLARMRRSTHRSLSEEKST